MNDDHFSSTRCDSPAGDPGNALPAGRCRPPRFHFGLGALFAWTVGLAATMGVLRWLGAPPAAATIVLVVLLAALLGAVALATALAGEAAAAARESPLLDKRSATEAAEAERAAEGEPPSASLRVLTERESSRS